MTDTPSPAPDHVSCRDHYQGLLARHYIWAFGGAEALRQAAETAVEGWFPAPRRGGHALDLGCGPGFHTLALARRGFRVAALDTSRELLADLAARTGELPVRALEADLRALPALRLPPAEAILCLGDTLAHLASPGEVRACIADAAQALEPGGRLVLGFRDQSRELPAGQRCFLLRSAPDRLFTACIEYAPDAVFVTDMVHARGPEGWSLAQSRYRKTRLTRDQVAAICVKAGLEPESEENARGMITLVLRRPAAR
ncbi:MAG: class I SAM-dependent methyltransferase [Desulfovibrionaceae bacterium]